jgi:peptidoglycan/xylan/chitin deacetylase (PgdA/CDA1 family)
LAAVSLLPPFILSAVASFVPSCGWWGPVLTAFGSRYREVLIAFDGAPDPDETPVVLVLLERYRARAMFMVDQERLRDQGELVREMIQRGHGVGCAFSPSLGRSLWLVPPSKLKQDIEGCRKTLKRLAPDYPVQWVRSRYRTMPPWLHPVVESLGLKVLGASATDGGRTIHSIERALLKMRANVGKGGVVLFHHQQQDPSGHGTLPEMLEEMLIWLRGQGYTMGEG